MIRHVVLFRWNDDVDDDHIAEMGAALDELAVSIPTIRSYRHGRDLGINPGNHQYAVTGDFDDEQGYLTYRDDPAHQALIARYIAGRVAERAAMQFHIG